LVRRKGVGIDGRIGRMEVKERKKDGRYLGVEVGRNRGRVKKEIVVGRKKENLLDYFLLL
jgi:hypothetical protein